jgi:hypothetical protein
VSDHFESEVDQQTVARLTGAARRHAHQRESTAAETAAAVAELRELAGDRDDLLAEVAGLLIGFYKRTVEDLMAQAAAGYCIAAGADPDLIPRWIEVGRRRAAAARQVPSTGAAPGESLHEHVPKWIEPFPCPMRSSGYRPPVREEYRGDRP